MIPIKKELQPHPQIIIFSSNTLDIRQADLYILYKSAGSIVSTHTYVPAV